MFNYYKESNDEITPFVELIEKVFIRFALEKCPS